MDEFAAEVKSDVDRRMKRKGQGSKHGVSGKLNVGSPGFYPDGSLASAIPDRAGHMKVQIFLCVWEFLDPDIKAPSCPNCLSPDHVVSDGWDPQRRTVYGEYFNYELLGLQQKCTACRGTQGKGNNAATSSYKFAPWHPEVLRQLLRDLLMLFPGVNLRRSAIDRKIITRIEQALVRGVGFKAVADDFRENHLVYFHEMEVRYYFRLARKRAQGQASVVPGDNEKLRNPPVFGKHGDPLGYNGKTPGEKLLSNVWLIVFEGKEQYFHRHAQRVDGENTAGDKSHKMTKSIKVIHDKVFHGVYTMVNEFGQVLLQRPKRHVSVGALDEIKPYLEGLAQRFLLNGFAPLKVFYSNVCCGDRKIIKQTLGPASCPLDGDTTASPSAAAGETLPHLAFPPHEQAVAVVVKGERCDVSALACSGLLANARRSASKVAGGVTVLGFDCEWSVRVSGVRPVETIQLSAMDGDTVVFHVKPNENRAGIVPKALQEILAGVTVGHDMTLIRDSYDVVGAGMVDLGQLATKHLGIAVGSRSLESLSTTLLHRRLSKANSICMSNWEKQLSQGQVNYAALDARASVLLYAYTMARADPIFTCPRPSVQDLSLGTLLHLYTRTNSRFGAEGALVSHGSSERWDGTQIVVGASRAVVRLTKIQVGAALMLYPNEKKALRSLRDVALGKQVLWDVVNTRLPKDPSPGPMLPGEGGHRPPPQPSVDKLGGTSSAGVEQETASTVNAGASVEVPGEPGVPRVILDLGHAENRVGNSGSKMHGAHGAFMAHLRDALAVPDPVKLQEAKDIWKARHPTWSDREIDCDMKVNYTNMVLKHVPRTVPQAPVAVPRYDVMCNAFENLSDAKTALLTGGQLQQETAISRPSSPFREVHS